MLSANAERADRRRNRYSGWAFVAPYPVRRSDLHRVALPTSDGSTLAAHGWTRGSSGGGQDARRPAGLASIPQVQRAGCLVVLCPCGPHRPAVERVANRVDMDSIRRGGGAVQRARPARWCRPGHV